MFSNFKTTQSNKNNTPHTPLNLALINIEDLHNKSFITSTVMEKFNKVTGNPIHIWGITESWETHATPFFLPNYHWYGKPTTQIQNAPRRHGGIGFWIHNTIIQYTTIFQPT